MLIDWLPLVLKRFCKAAQKPALRKPLRTGLMLTMRVEDLEVRQMLSGTNNIDPLLMEIAADPASLSSSTSISAAFTAGATPSALNSASASFLPTSGGSTGTGSGASGSSDLTPSLVAHDQFGRVGVHITSSNVSGLLPTLQSMGFAVTGSRPDLNFVEGFITPSKITSLGSLSNILGVIPIYKPVVYQSGPTADQATGALGVDRVLDTAPPGYDGTGVRVGVISDSFNTNGAVLTAEQNGDLPSTVQVLKDDLTERTDEGRAMAELVHDTAPGASISFASGDFGEADFAQQIRNLANPAIGNADIIVDDLGYLGEPFFQDGVVAQAVNEVVNYNGVSYFSAAGNNGSQSYQVSNPQFVTDPNTAAPFGPGTYLNFGTAASPDIRNRVDLSNGGYIQLSLQWSDPFYTINGVKTDLDVYLVDDATGQVLASGTSNNLATQIPLEIAAASPTFSGNGFVDVIVKLESGPAPQMLKWVDFSEAPGFYQYDTQSSTVVGHPAAANAMSVAAAPYFDSRNVESFSSQGGSTILFTPTGSPLGSPQVRQTPSITSIDGSNTSFFTGSYLFADGGFSQDVEGDLLPNFFGTSAAAPHAAAVAALLKQANPGMTPQQIYTRLKDTAIDIGAPGVDNFTGAGLISAYAALFGGPIDASLNFADSFEGGGLSSYWEANTSGNGSIAVTTTHGATDGTHSFTMGSQSDTGFSDSLNQAILHIDLSTASDDVYLSFDAKDSATSLTPGDGSDGQDPMSSVFFGSENSDGVAISVDGGVTWRRIISLTGAQISTSFQSHKINLSALAQADGFGLTSDTLIMFQQFDSATFFGFIQSNPITVDNVQVFTNQPPTVNLNASPLNYAINSPPVNIDANASIQDSGTNVFDGGTLTVAIVTGATSSDRIEIQDQTLIPNHVATPNDISLVGNRVLYGGLQIGTFIGGSGNSPLVITFNSNSTRAAAQFLLQDITFRTSSTSLAQRTVQVTLDDGSGAGAATVTRSINISPPANVAPKIGLNANALNVQPGTTATVIDATATVTDPDSANFAGGVLTVKITTNASTTYDRIEIRNQGNGIGLIGFSGSTIKFGGVAIGTLSGGTTSRTITLNANATPAAVQALLRNITFRTISTSAPLGTRTVQYTLTDGDGGTSPIASKLVNVVKKNQPPKLTGTTTIPTYHLGMAPVIIEPSATVSDPDTTVFTGGTLTVSLTANGTVFDKLSVKNQGSNVGQIAVSGGTTVLYGGIQIGTISGGTGSTSPLVITFNSNATSAAVRALMRDITFQTGGTIPSLKQRTITFSLTDGQGGVSNTVTKFVKVSKT